MKWKWKWKWCVEQNYEAYMGHGTFPVAMRSKAEVCSLHLLRLLGAWKFVSCEYCVLSGRGLCNELIACAEKSYRIWSNVVYKLENSRMRRPWPTLGCSTTGWEKKRGHGMRQSSWLFLLSYEKRECNIPCSKWNTEYRARKRQQVWKGYGVNYNIPEVYIWRIKT